MMRQLWLSILDDEEGEALYERCDGQGGSAGNRRVKLQRKVLQWTFSNQSNDRALHRHPEVSAAISEGLAVKRITLSTVFDQPGKTDLALVCWRNVWLFWLAFNPSSHP